jgi:hypothetical protein
MNPPKVGRCFLRLNISPYQPLLAGYRRGEPAAEAANWAEYQGLKNFSYDVLSGKTIQHYGKAGRMITDLRQYPLPAIPWFSEWQIRPSRAFPESPAQRADDGNWPKLLHDVNLGMWSFSAGSAVAKSEMVCGRGPWPGSMTIKNPATGSPVTATVGLKNALDYRILTRKSDKPGLESVFVQAIEAHTPEQKAELAEFAVDQPRPLSEGGGVVARFKLADGGTGVFASTLNGEKIETPSLTIKGRMAALFPQANRLTLVDGTVFQSEDWKLALEPGWEMNLSGVIGDLTGQPQESALIVESTRVLPNDGTLQGQFVYVQHQASPHLQSVYTIEAVKNIGGNRWRLDLAGTPPFIVARANVLKVDDKDPRQMEQTFQFMILNGASYGKKYMQGHRIRFPRSGFETALTESATSTFSVTDAPATGQVVKGDPFVVYAIQGGDRVRIPSRFACTGEKAGDGSLRLSVQTTGAANLVLPGKYAKAEIEAAGRKTEITLRLQGVTSTVVDIVSGALPDGRGVIQLKP